MGLDSGAWVRGPYAGPSRCFRLRMGMRRFAVPTFMRLEPVYLLAPKKQPPTRRAFLVFAGGFAGGALLGGACGYSLGTMSAASPVPSSAGGPDSAKSDDLPSSGDARLDALRRLAVKAPIEELVGVWADWWGEFDFNYGKDPILWQGLDRLAVWAMEHPVHATRPLLGVLVQLGRQDRREGMLPLRRLVPDLERLHKSKPR